MSTVKLPGFCDVHVHFREPGFSYKETIKSGSMAAAAGGYTAVCAMPNLNPVPDCPENLAAELSAIGSDAVINVLPYGAITRGENGAELSDMEGMADSVAAFSDDGKGVQDEEIMLRAMLEAKRLGKLIAAHCEDNALLSPGGCIHDGTFARSRGYTGISAESEWRQIERDLALAKETRCRYHVCHVSCGESVELIRKAKADGVDVTCETAPHYLVLDDSMLREEGRFKMNPPVRSPEDKKELLRGVIDGTVDCIATDHAPHSLEEKAKGLAGSAFGIVGLETAFPVLYTKLVMPGIVRFDRIVEMLTVAPRRRFGITADAGTCEWDLDCKYVIDPEKFLTMGRATPFAGETVFGKCLRTVCRDKPVYICKEA